MTSIDHLTADLATLDDLVGAQTLFSPEDLQWRDRAREVADRWIRPVVDADFDAARFRREVIPAFAEAGLLGMHLTGPGCAGASGTAYGLVCAEIESADSGWRTLLSVQGSLAMTAINLFGSAVQRESLLPEMAAGRLLGCFALTEAHGGSDPGAMRTTAVRDGDEWVITGAKRWIGLANLADVAVVWACTRDGIRGFVVPTATPGFTATPIDGKLAMRTSVQCEVALDGVRVPADALLPGSRGLSSPLTCLNQARFGIAWGALGIARECIAIAVHRARTRESFGAPLAAKQLVQERIAEMAVAYQNALLTAVHLARLEDAGGIRPAQISIAKLNNVRTAIRIARSTRELLGGDGITAEFSVMRHMNNLEAVRTYEGTDDIHVLSIGRALTGVSAF